jgi:dipeptidyl aminopeptidase/acylaminoacyl peptidase
MSGCPAVARASATLLAVGALATLPAAARAQITVEDALAFSFASGLVGSETGDRIAWVENDRGARNVWVAEGPAWEGRAVTAYPDDDGQEIGSVSFMPDGTRILYVRGGAPNRQGEIPDPRSTPDAEGRTVWIVSTAGGEARKLVDGGGFALAPDGSRIAYGKGREIWLLGVEEGAEAAKLATVRGDPGGFRWSPDGTGLAFVSNRGDHAFVGVVDPASGRVRYLDPSVHQDGSPAWSPDSKRIAFLRVPHERDQFPFAPRRAGLPFSIRVADAATGEGREVWRASEGTGSVFSGVDADSQLFWGAGDHLVFPWEGDGWKHLYSVPASGGRAVPLTPGGFEVQYVGMTPDRRRMLYDANQDDIDRKHVWTVDVAGGTPRPLTPGTGLEWGAVNTGGGTLAFHASSTARPAHTVVMAGGARREVGPPLPAAFPVDRMVTPRQVVFRAADGMEIHAQLFLPPGARAGERHPAMVFFHGGSRRQMLLGFHHRDYYSNAYAFNQVLASRGYVVLAVNYRSGIGYGMEFREALNYGATGASEFNDVIGAGLYLQSRDDVDRARIGLWGGSYGGYLTALGLSRASDVFAAGVDLHGVHDWNIVIKNFVPDYEAEAHPEFSELAFESSPMASIDGWRSPVLLIHGDDDRNVPFSESVDLAESLAERHVDFEQLVFPDEVHGFLLHRSWRAAYEAALDFLGRKLGGDRADADGSPASRFQEADGVRALYQSGRSFGDFLDAARSRRDQWQDHYRGAAVPDSLLSRALAAGGTWRLLAIAEDWCGDSANTIPYLARLVERVPGLEMRVVDSKRGRAVMETHRTPDGRPATPTVVLLDEAWREVGSLVERPAPLTAWYQAHRADMSSEALHERIYAWYDEDRGASTVADIIALMERGSAGQLLESGFGQKP